MLHRALKQIIACFPVYRTYVDGGPATEADRRDIDWAVAQARRLDTDVDPSVFDFLHKVLSGDLAAPLSGFSHVAATRLAMRVQQYSGPVMAKGLEDTAFYRYNRFLALNEVGGSPDQFGVSIAQFHAANLQRAKRTPHAHAQHIDARHQARRGCSRAARGAFRVARRMGGARDSMEPHSAGAARPGPEVSAPPDRNDEYAFYQLLLAAWPPELLGSIRWTRIGQLFACGSKAR